MVLKDDKHKKLRVCKKVNDKPNTVQQSPEILFIFDTCILIDFLYKRVNNVRSDSYNFTPHSVQNQNTNTNLPGKFDLKIRIHKFLAHCSRQNSYNKM